MLHEIRLGLERLWRLPLWIKGLIVLALIVAAIIAVGSVIGDGDSRNTGAALKSNIFLGLRGVTISRDDFAAGVMEVMEDGKYASQDCNLLRRSSPAEWTDFLSGFAKSLPGARLVPGQEGDPNDIAVAGLVFSDFCREYGY